MAKQLDRVVVIDVESTCWNRRPPKGQISEIIEIGICTVDVTSLACREKRSIMVKPQRSQVSEFCTELTSIDQAMADKGIDLGSAVKILKDEYSSETRLFGSWGDYDRGQFQRNCADYNLKYPFGPTHLNIKNLFAISYGLPTEPTLDVALEKAGLKMEGVHHRGVDDAWNTARLFCLILKRMRRAGA